MLIKIYCIGIGGIGVSAYASLQHAKGHTVLGSDMHESQITKALQADNIWVTTNQDGLAIDASIDLIVYSAAVPKTATERVRGYELGIPQMSYFEALGVLTRDLFVIAVCGTHGKSSTTAMLAQAAIELGLDPTVIVGTKVPFLDGRNWRNGQSNICIVEACEFERSFLHLSPDVIILTNADGDHFDTYGTITEYTNAFKDFVRLLPNNGCIITHGSDPICHKIAQEAPTYYSVDSLPLPTLHVPGLHMQQNAQLVLGLQYIVNTITESAIRTALLHYTGSWRRLELIGHTVFSIPVIDDYGHHPVEISANIQAIKSLYGAQRFVLVFQPHTHNRTMELYTQFTQCFTNVDLLVLLPVYEARKEKDSTTVDMITFIADIKKNSNCIVYSVHSLQDAENELKNVILHPNDVLVCMGAGDITNLARRMCT